jgi:hypothetical protein
LKEQNAYQALSDNEEKQLEQVVDIIQEVVNSYTQKDRGISDEDWAKDEFSKHKSEFSEIETEVFSKEITASVHSFDRNLQSIETAMLNGTSKEKWFQDKIQEATVGIEINKVGQYLQEIDLIIANSNNLMHKTIMNADGSINQNPNLDGFIFEQHHVNSFNMDAILKGDKHRAEVLLPKPGGTYTKNSVDIVIKDAFGKIVKKYQAKFYTNAEASNNAFDKGNYPFQGKLVGETQTGQVINSKDIIGVGKVKGSPLSKQDGKGLQKLAQEGKSIDVDWNYYKLKDLSSHMTKNVAYAGLQSATIAVGFDLVYKKMSGQNINGDEIVEIALRTGSDAGIKSATTVGLKIASEKGLISLIPKGTPAGIIANVACVAIENVKVLSEIARGELTIAKGLEKMERVTVATVSGLVCSSFGTVTGAVIGAVALSWIPLVGPMVGGVVGGLVGGTVAYMAGSKVGEVVCRAHQKVRETVVNVIKSGARAVGNAVSTAWNSFKSVFS